MKWPTTNTELANRINGGNMFEDKDVISAETLNVIFKEILDYAELIKMFATREN